MSLFSPSFALSAEFRQSWVSLHACLLSAHLAQQGKQIKLAYVAVTRWTPPVAVL